MTTILLRQLGAEHLDRWVRVDGLTGVLHSVGHSRTGITSVDVRSAVGGIRLGFGRPEIEHYTSDTKVELLSACEACENPIVDEEPVWGGEDGDEPLHRHCVPNDPAQQVAERTVAVTQHTIAVPGHGTARVAHNGQGWTWGCDRCEAGALLIDSSEDAVRDARWHLKHDHEPLPADDQRHSDGVTTQVRRDEHARCFVELAEPAQPEIDDRLEANGLPVITEPGRGSASISRAEAGWAWSCDGWPDCAGLVATSYPSYASAAHTARSHLRGHRPVHTEPEATQ